MAKGNWTRNPGPQSDAGQTDKDRGTETGFPYGQGRRQTGRAGRPMSKPNQVPEGIVQPMSRPKQ